MDFPKIIITDIDGVWTDGGMYYDEQGNELKKFHTYDSAGVMFCKILNVPVGIVTGERTEIVKRRAEKLKIDFLEQDIKDKLSVVKEIVKKYNVELKDIAYIGDDLNDIEVLRSVGFSASVFNAPEYIKKEVDYVTLKKGGEGAFREFVEYMLKESGLLDEVLNKFGIRP